MKPLFSCLLVVVLAGIFSGCGKKEPIIPSEPSPAFSYTDNISSEMIPVNGVWGQVDGTPFKPVTSYFEPGLEGWALVICEKEFESPEDIFMDDSRALVLEFAKEPAAGKIYTEPMGFSDELNGYLIMPTGTDEDGDGLPNYSPWNTENAYLVEITDWELGSFDPEASDFQVKGKASGKFAICLQKNDTYAPSWVAGTFKDVPIRYSGEPSWE